MTNMIIMNLRWNKRKWNRIAETAVLWIMNGFLATLVATLAFAFSIATCHLFGWDTDWATDVWKTFG